VTLLVRTRKVQGSFCHVNSSLSGYLVQQHQLYLMRHSILVLLAVLVLSSCKSTTEPDTDDTVRWVMPKAGAQFKMAIATTDSNSSGSVTNDDVDIFIIHAVNVPWLGRDSTYRYGWSNTGATYHVSFEPNGNTGYEVNTAEGIEIYPTGTKTRMTVPTDTEDYGELVYTKTNYKEYQGKEKITLGGVTYDAIKVFGQVAEVTMQKSTGTLWQSTTTNQTWWFVPSLGFCAKTVRDIIHVQDGESSLNRRSQTLVKVI
jgi:hypothetical protein